MNSGIALALGAFLLWGVFPLYLRLLVDVPPAQILGHRIVWSLLTIGALLLATRRVGVVRAAFAQPRLLGRFVITAGLISVNWILYIWSANTGHVVDASLGYFINPLLNVLFAAVLLGERLRLGQKLPIGLAALGVAWITWLAGGPPWIGLGIAITFSLYGLLRKTAALGALEGFAIETVVLTPVALAYLGWQLAAGTLAFAQEPISTRALLALAGPVTAVPLLLFAAAARRMSFSLLGILQYLAPTLQWLLGILVFHEAFDAHKATGFALIWLAIVLYALEGLWFGYVQGREAKAAA